MIANGRVCGDLTGKYTCCQRNGMSIVDLFILPEDLLNRLKYFKVADFDWYSDHAYISADLSVGISKAHDVPRAWSKLVTQFHNWDLESKNKFIDELSSHNISARLETFCNTSFEDNTQCANSFTNIITDVLTKVFPRKRKSVTCKETSFLFTWMSTYKRILKKSKQRFNCDRGNIDRRQEYILDKRRFRKAIYKAKRIYQENKINRIAELENSDPKRLWRDLNKIIKPMNDCTNSIDPDKWQRHLRSVLDPSEPSNVDQQHSDYVLSSLPIIEGVAVKNDVINAPIYSKELLETAASLKAGKAMYLDEISNDAIKCGIRVLEAPLLHLYNHVLSLGSFPQTWSDGLIIPLHKKNDKLCVDNYRGLMISSCVGKLFTKILTKRIDKFMRENGLWKFNQCGFKADHRTEDNLFILNTIYEKYINTGNEMLYTAFVDFSKLFDKINRKFLLYKLLKYNITGNVYNIIKSMYSNSSYQILINGNLSPKLSASLGVKQGCCMSLILSNIFQNYLHDIFAECDPIVLENIYFNSISWADDLLLMSTSKEGLQRCLDKLHGYCAKWGLEVNVSKTKSMVLSKSNFISENFRYGNLDIECVRSIQYLGFSITYNLNLKCIMSDRINKASKMADMLLRAIRTTGNVSVKLSLSIFDMQISPVVLYGSPIWATPKSYNLLYLDNQDEGVNARSIASRVLQYRTRISSPSMRAFA